MAPANQLIVLSSSEGSGTSANNSRSRVTDSDQAFDNCESCAAYTVAVRREPWPQGRCPHHGGLENIVPNGRRASDDEHRRHRDYTGGPPSARHPYGADLPSGIRCSSSLSFPAEDFTPRCPSLFRMRQIALSSESSAILYSAIRLSGIFLLDVRHRSLMSSILSAAVTAASDFSEKTNPGAQNEPNRR
jgi:hypothetical protein